jgi:orotidine-5'-phosphate decarboxylase
VANFADNLLGAIVEKRSCVCVGIDPNFSKLPAAIAGPVERRASASPRQVVDGFYDFVTGVLDATAEHAACVKFQSAYFEQYHAEGVEAYYSLIAEAKAKGLLVIGDVKRGDIGATSEAYAAGHLAPMPPGGDADTPDAITVNPMLGLDTLEPFAEAAGRAGKGLFVLVRTSNPGSAELQDAPLADGRTWSEALADRLAALAGPYAGERGYSAIGAVVGATQPHTMQSLRKRLPRSIFLLPGYGTQGATAEMTRAAFDENGLGAIVSASRSVLYPKSEPGGDWKSAIARAAAEMKQDLQRTLKTPG